MKKLQKLSIGIVLVLLVAMLFTITTFAKGGGNY